MGNNNLLDTVKAEAQKWLDGAYDEETKNEVKRMLSNPDNTELIDSFYKSLEFGTGGLRGIMGAGSNRVNKYTIGAATQGLANYLNREFAHLPELKVAIGHDCRNNSRYFAEIVAGVFAANNIIAYLFEDLRPTPEISYTIRKLNCQSGVILTASHNPKEYNGYKAYWNDGAQIIAPHDKNIIDEVNKITSVEHIKFEGNADKIRILGEEMDNLFIEEVSKISLNPEIIQKQKDLKIVYSPIHGTTVKIVPQALRKFGFENIINVPEQDVVSGDFPTVISPNPEEPEALKMAIEKAIETDAELVAASDPDGDRLGIAIRNDKNEFILVNGNQTALLLTWYMISQWKERGLLTGKEFTVKTIVTSELIKKIADDFNVECFDAFTGFKWIAAIIRDLEGTKKYICGGEESYGFLPGDYVRDKDAVGAICMIAEVAAWAKENGKTLFELLKDIYIDHGFSYERLLSIVRKGKSGADEITAMMERFRNNPPKTLGGSKVNLIKDYLTLVSKNPNTGETHSLEMPANSDVLQFFTEDGSKISVRPSGTEPKIKFYFEVQGAMKNRDQFEMATAEANKKIDLIIKDLKLD
ncbi:phospho-sugar mutase [Alkalitalea saponilacus]|uniref:Phosphoglucomutase n=1 Tax=Alkalitalea saponilacus TaxID=889453 RepID=A0A1T5H9V3_9BACT|nr:phospho-sugar mutase [Alkalitalea saponilacus]ASB51208.1 phosphoglucomutase [Alkalitalea saponilacus]SKC17349.1 phosphoglucomutase [Alkalitalea saponilacus]